MLCFMMNLLNELTVKLNVKFESSQIIMYICIMYIMICCIYERFLDSIYYINIMICIYYQVTISELRAEVKVLFTDHSTVVQEVSCECKSFMFIRINIHIYMRI
jgi:hypothetical protein